MRSSTLSAARFAAKVEPVVTATEDDRLQAAARAAAELAARPGMAVYTEVADEELDAFIASYDDRRADLLQGHRRGRRELELPRCRPRPGRYILTLYEKRVEPADLPFFLGADGASRRAAASPAPCPSTTARAGALRQLAGRPAAIVTFLDGVSVRRAALEQCAGARRSACASCTSPARISRCARANAFRSPAGRRSSRMREQADGIIPGLAGEIGKELDYLEANWPAELPAGVIHADLFPDNVLLPRQRGHRPDRFLLRLQRHARLRHRHLPQRLVLRVRCELQRHQGARAAAGL